MNLNRRLFIQNTSSFITNSVICGFAAPACATSDDSNLTAAIASEKARAAFWKKIGKLESDSLSGFDRKSDWPGYSSRYLIVRRKKTILITSDGLSNLFEGKRKIGEPNVNGFGFEFFIETPDIPESLKGSPGDVTGIGRSWALATLQAVCSTVAYRDGIKADLEKYGVLSFDLPGAKDHFTAGQIPEKFVTDDGAIGVLIGKPEPDFSTTIPNMPLTSVIALPVVLVTAEETYRLRTNSTSERKKLVRELIIAKRGHISQFKIDKN